MVFASLIDAMKSNGFTINKDGKRKLSEILRVFTVSIITALCRVFIYLLYHSFETDHTKLGIFFQNTKINTDLVYVYDKKQRIVKRIMSNAYFSVKFIIIYQMKYTQ